VPVPGQGSPHGGVIAHEKEGVGGKRYVAYPTGAVEEVEDAKFNQLVSR
jgi:hypothetical protein